MVKKQLVKFPVLEGGFVPVGIKWRGDEHTEQVAVIQWAAWKVFEGRRCVRDEVSNGCARDGCARDGEQVRSRWEDLDLLFAVPNGGERDRIVAGRMKAEGVRSGVPDLCLPVARGGFFGLWIEMKRFDGGQVSSSQEKFLQALASRGHAVAVCYGAEQAIQVLIRYLGMPETERVHS